MTNLIKKAAIISDIHANLEALTAIFKKIEKLGDIDEIWCLGDVIGYGQKPIECLEKILEAATYILLGNHDYEVCVLKKNKGFKLIKRERKFVPSGRRGNPQARDSWTWTFKQLNKHECYWERLFELPTSITIEELKTKLVHGTEVPNNIQLNHAHSVWEYILSADNARAAIAALCRNHGNDAMKILFHGHTHMPYIWLVSVKNGRLILIDYALEYDGWLPDSQNDLIEGQLPKMRIDLNQENLWAIFCPGAVGQRRTQSGYSSDYASMMLASYFANGWCEVEHVLVDFNQYNHIVQLRDIFGKDKLMKQHVETLQKYFLD